MYIRFLTSPKILRLELIGVFVYVICDLKLCVNYMGLENGVRLAAKGMPWGCSHNTWGENRLVRSEAWDQGRWIFVSAFDQVGFL